MFVIYYFAAHGLKQSECENLFGEDKSVLVSRYCTAAQKALIAADFISSSSLTTLQAFVLFLVSLIHISQADRHMYCYMLQ